MLITFDITWNKQVYVVCYKKKIKTNTINTSNHAIEIFLRIIGARRKEGIGIGKQVLA